MTTYIILKTIKPTLYDTEVNNDSQRAKKLKIDNENETYLWHLRLGHINQEKIKRLVGRSFKLFTRGFNPHVRILSRR